MRQLTVTDRERVLASAWSRLGVGEQPANTNRVEFSRWYGMVGPWCAMFVSWAFHETLGHSPFPATTSKGFAYCPSGVHWFRSQGAWAGKDQRPERGWVVFFDFIGRPSHVGIVLGVLPDGRIHTIEGNTNGRGSRDGGSVMEHFRSTRTVVGYGIVDYAPDSAAPVIPPTPRLTRTLVKGVADLPGIPEAERAEVVEAVRWVHGRLKVVLPHWDYAGPVVRSDARFDDATVIAVVYFKAWCNAIARLVGNPEPFAELNGSVGTVTASYLAWYGAFYAGK